MNQHLDIAERYFKYVKYSLYFEKAPKTTKN